MANYVIITWTNVFIYDDVLEIYVQLPNLVNYVITCTNVEIYVRCKIEYYDHFCIMAVICKEKM